MLRTENAFDIGTIVVGELELGFVNEYLTAESGGERLATFPDVLATLSTADRADHLDRRHPRGRRGRGPARSQGQRPARRRRQGAERLPGGRGDARQAAGGVRACLTAARIAARLQALWEIAHGPGRRRRPPGVLVRRGAGDAAGRRMGPRGGARAGDRRPRQPVGAAGGWDGPLVTSGSHVDTVPDGGRYDGALGTVLGLELADELGTARWPGRGRPARLRRRGGAAVRRRHDRLAAARRHAGRSALCGALRDATGSTRRAGPRRVPGGARRSCRAIEPPVARAARPRRGPRRPAPRAARARRRHARGISTPAAVIEISGEAGHSGEVSMDERRDALAAAAEVVLAVEAAAARRAAADGRHRRDARGRARRAQRDPGPRAAAASTSAGSPRLAGAARRGDPRRRRRDRRRGAASTSRSSWCAAASRSTLDARPGGRGAARRAQAAASPATETWSGAGHDAQHLAALFAGAAAVRAAAAAARAIRRTRAPTRRTSSTRRWWPAKCFQ